MLSNYTNLSSSVEETFSLNITINNIPLPFIGIIFSFFTIVAFISNLSLLIYIISNRLYRNFISSHFIAHLCITNMITLILLLPIFIHDIWTGESTIIYNNLLCRIQTLLTCSVWTVTQFMVLCIAGVHLLTFARIHYEQLFGLPPSMLCALAWLIAFGLALPTLTNGHIVIYDPSFRHCVWGNSDSGLKFLTYQIIIGVFIPATLALYAYIRVLGILYHSPIVFQSIGLYKSRFLVYAFLLSPFYQLPFYLATMIEEWRSTTWIMPIISVFLAYMQSIISPALYGASLFLMKEEDMVMTARAQKAPNAHRLTQNL